MPGSAAEGNPLLPKGNTGNSDQSRGTCGSFQFLHNEKCYYCFWHFILFEFDLGISYFNKPIPEVDYYYSDNCMEINF